MNTDRWTALFQPLLGPVYLVDYNGGSPNPYVFRYRVQASNALMANIQTLLPPGGRVEAFADEHGPYVDVLVPSMTIQGF